MNNESPCKIIQLLKSKTIGKVGIPKALIKGIDLTSGKKYQQMTYLKNYVKTLNITIMYTFTLYY